MAGFKLSLDATKGTFKLRGIVTGVSKETFYVEKKTKAGKPWRNVNFGVRVSKDSVIYVGFNGQPQEKVYFGSSEKDADGNRLKPVAVDWDKRNSFKQKGFSLIGVNIGLVKTNDEKGKEVNDIQHLTPFDGADYVAKHLKDGMSVFIKGNLEYSHFEAQNGEVAHSVKFVPNQISLCQDIDPSFGPDKDGKAYEVVANFEQTLVYQDVEQDSNDKSKFIVSGNIVNYNTIETTTFVTTNATLASTLKKKVKPYTALKVYGDLVSVRNVEEVEDDGWGGKNPMKVNAPYKVERMITGAEKDSLDWTNYSEEKMDEALAAIKKEEAKKAEFESAGSPKSSGGDDWGKKNDSSDDDDDDNKLPWDN